MINYVNIAINLAEERKIEERQEALHKSQQELYKETTLTSYYSQMKCEMSKFHCFQGISFQETVEYNYITKFGTLTLNKNKKDIVSVSYYWWEIPNKPVLYVKDVLTSMVFTFNEVPKAMEQVAKIVSKYL